MANAIYTLTHSGSQVDDAVEQSLQTADYIVETGESGIWTYRKWNSGLAECFGVKTVSTEIKKSWGALYESTAQSENYPSGLFTTVPTILATPNGFASFVEISGLGTSTATPNIFLVRPVSTDKNTYKINIHAIGRWK